MMRGGSGCIFLKWKPAKVKLKALSVACWQGDVGPDRIPLEEGWGGYVIFRGFLIPRKYRWGNLPLGTSFHPVKPLLPASPSCLLKHILEPVSLCKRQFVWQPLCRFFFFFSWSCVGCCAVNSQAVCHYVLEGILAAKGTGFKSMA